MSAAKAVEIANKITGVGRDWPFYWKRFCDKHEVKTRPAIKRDGSKAKGRREVEVGSLVRAVEQHSDEFEKASSETQRRRNAIRASIRREYDILPEIRQDILEGR